MDPFGVIPMPRALTSGARDLKAPECVRFDVEIPAQISQLIENSASVHNLFIRRSSSCKLRLQE
jgi:hypothetical protein